MRPPLFGFELPDEVRHIYQETYGALYGGKPILAGIGIRTIVEAVCKEKEAAGCLAKQIDQLALMRLITPSGADILHRLRGMGNEAAHETKSHTVDELRLAMEVVEHLFNEVYILPLAANRLPRH